PRPSTHTTTNGRIVTPVTADHNISSRSCYELLENHSGRDLALLCLDVVPSQDHATARGWIIGVWPEVPEVLTYARQALNGREPEVVGVLYGYGPQRGPTAAQIVADAAALLSPLEPALRVVAAQQLARRGTDADVVIDLLEDWRSDVDPAVRRAAVTTLARTLASARSGTTQRVVQPSRRRDALERLRQECRADLRSYAVDLDAERRTAWVIMLLLGDVTLLDGVLERHNGSPVSVDLEYLSDSSDAQLVELIVANWAPLQQQCANQLVERLAGRLGQRDSKQAQVWSALAPAAHRKPEVGRALQDAILRDPELLRDRQVLTWYCESNPSDPQLMDLAVQAAEAGYPGGDPRSVLDLVGSAPVSPVSRQALLNRLIQRPGRVQAPALITDEVIDMYVTGWRRVALARLLPEDPHAQSLYRNLGAMLGSKGRSDWTWEQACEVTIGLAPPTHVPILLLRLSERLHRLGEDYAAAHLVDAAVHRLRRDPEAEEAVLAAVLQPDSIDMSTPLWRSSDVPRGTDIAHQQVLLASVLAAATGLPPAGAKALTPLTGMQSALGDNPLMTPRPIALVVLDLLDAAS
ncbi:hypothetical protein ACFWTC_28865, partial [Streptomyces sp. NPDC058619]|uniref:hypothetical protein n=2 Tax=unclassified Streptomyces TaxID=2593676 RepID=UPI00365907F2